MILKQVIPYEGRLKLLHCIEIWRTEGVAETCLEWPKLVLQL